MLSFLVHRLWAELPASVSGVSIVYYHVAWLVQSWAYNAARPIKETFAGMLGIGQSLFFPEIKGIKDQVILELTERYRLDQCKETPCLRRKPTWKESKGQDGKGHDPVILVHHLDPAVLELDMIFELCFFIPWVSVTCKQNGSGKCYRYQKRLSIAIYFMV